MTDRPIIFSAPMVRALLEGRKTQTRRVLGGSVQALAREPAWEAVKGADGVWRLVADASDVGGSLACNERYAVGDRLWVREAHALLPRLAYRGSIGTGTIDQREHPTDGYTAAVLREGFDRSGRPRWRPSIHMPRWASRLTLPVVSVRVQRLLDITEEDAEAEGVCHFAEQVHGAGSFKGLSGAERTARVCSIYGSCREAFRALWESLHGPASWNANPWVVAVGFDVHRANIDTLPAAGIPVRRVAATDTAGRA